MRDTISIRGARENNLKNVSVDIPRNKLIVMTGVSGSGKSSLAFDTIYAEGQRRYMESLSSYARQFLGQMEKPDVDHIEGLSPAIAIDQKTTGKNPRSTVGTVTEIYDYMRLLWARVGVPHCPKCGKEIQRQSIDQIVDQILKLPGGTRIQVLSPRVRARKGEHVKVFADAKKSGFVRARVDGSIYDLSEEIELDKNKKHSIEIVVDRIVLNEDVLSRLTDSVETAANAADGLVIIDVGANGENDILFSQNYACEDCGISLEELTPRMFSFNNPAGSCPECTGIGSRVEIDPALIVPNTALSIRQGCIRATGWGAGNNIADMYYEGLADQYNFSLTAPWRHLPQEARDAVLYGTKKQRLAMKYQKSNGQIVRYTHAFEGIIPNLMRRWGETQSEVSRADIEELMTRSPCPACGGRRLKPESLAVTVGGVNIADACAKPIEDAVTFLQSFKLEGNAAVIAAPILKEIQERLGFLQSVGLGYLTLSRHAGSLSGGESQRIRLATQIGSYLMGVLYILDEPSIGLHQRDNDKLLATLRRLRDLGNTVLVVEHDEETIAAADYVVDIGIGAGVHGGEIICAGTVEDIKACPQSVTGTYLKNSIPLPPSRIAPGDKWLTVRGAAENNLQSIDAAFPLGLLTAVTGVSGSGKSSLVNHILYAALASALNRAHTRSGKHIGIDGLEHLDKVIDIDQSPIGRTTRSNPATYTGLFTPIRELFAQTQDSKARGYKAGRFSFNIKGGRCEACAGDGLLKIEMHFLPDVYVPCDVCKGKRFNRETLEVRYKGKNIHDVLELTCEEARDFFENLPALKRKLDTLCEVGLGYIKLGQPSTTLSGGEAQRVKLATELARRPTGRTIYILDEPTTGLHAADVHKLIHVLTRLRQDGNTVVVIEHNLDVIKTADWVIDLGPEGGAGGGRVLAQGTPEDVARVEASYTGAYLKPLLLG